MERCLHNIDSISRGFGGLSRYMLLALVVFVFMGVMLRYVFNAPSKWIPEVSQFLFATSLMLGGAVTLLWGGHVNLDAISGRLPPRKRAILDLASSVFFWLFCGVLLYQAVGAAWISVSHLETTATNWDPPIWPMKIMVVVAVLLMMLQGAAKFIRDWHVATTGRRLE